MFHATTRHPAVSKMLLAQTRIVPPDSSSLAPWDWPEQPSRGGLFAGHRSATTAPIARSLSPRISHPPDEHELLNNRIRLWCCLPTDWRSSGCMRQDHGARRGRSGHADRSAQPSPVGSPFRRASAKAVGGRMHPARSLLPAAQFPHDADCLRGSASMKGATSRRQQKRQRFFAAALPELLLPERGLPVPDGSRASTKPMCVPRADCVQLPAFRDDASADSRLRRSRSARGG